MEAQKRHDSFRMQAGTIWNISWTEVEPKSNLGEILALLYPLFLKAIINKNNDYDYNVNNNIIGYKQLTFS